MTELITVRGDGSRWQVVPEVRERLFRDNDLPLEDWVRDGLARVVKHGPHRTVYRVQLPGLDVYVKHNRLADTTTWLRQLIRPAKSRLEFDRARAVLARGVPTIEPLGYGERGSGLWPAESLLITRALDDTEPLGAFLDRTLPTFDPQRQVYVRHGLARALGRFLARLHEAGIVHHDLHAGNLLLRLGNDKPELFLVDPHAVQVGKSLDWEKSQDNLVLLNRWFQLGCHRPERRRFWHAYVEARAGTSLAPAARQLWDDRGREVETKTWESNRAFWSDRDRRCVINNRYYRRVGAGPVVGFAVRDLDAPALQTLMVEPDAPFDGPGTPLLKDSRSSTVMELEVMIDGVPRRAIYKRFRVTSWGDPWRSLLRRSEALRSWVMGQGLLERGLPTARPLAVFHRRRRGLAHEGYLLTELIPEAVDLHTFATRLVGGPRVVFRRYVEHVARLIRELHLRGIAHRDLKAANVLMSPVRCPRALVAGPTLDHHAWLIDLVGATRHRELSRDRIVQNLARLHASFHRDSFLTRTEKLRFLRVYLEWGYRGKESWKRYWMEIDAATRRKVARNLHNGRVLA